MRSVMILLAIPGPILHCWKLARFITVPKRLWLSPRNDFVRKDFKVKMSPKLDKSAMARRIAEKKREAAKVKDENPALCGVPKTVENVEQGDPSGFPKKFRIKMMKCQRRGRGLNNQMKFVGSSPEIRSMWDSRFEFGNMIDAECSLPGDQSQLDKWGPRSAHVMLQIQGICSAFLGRYLELQHVKGLSEIDTSEKKKIDLAERNKTLIDELSRMKTDKEAVEADLLQERSEHEKTKVKWCV
ncbi:hypothetical protein SESBI_09573 [Sesbania bispinosa]|nr:hypothetical protein SESBI_09573 [Sesbania bispinosa]